MLCSGAGRAALRTAARSTARTGRPRRAASSLPSAEPLPLGLLPPHPRSIRGVSRLARHPAAAASRRANGGGGSQRPFHACGGRAAAPAAGTDRGGWGAAAAGGKDGDEESSSSSSDSSDSSDEEAEGEVEEETGKDAGAAGAGTGSDRGSSRRKAPAAGAATKSVGVDKDALRAEVARHDADGGGEDADAEGEYDYRNFGSEIYEDGDLEAGETMQGMYDFVDDIVETQHVPTIQDPFDHKGRFHRCPGKRQGKAALPSTCQIFDIKELHVNHTPLLKRFVNDAGMILGRYRTGLCAKCQRKVAGTIKAARQMGLVPTVSDYEVRDTGPGGLFAWAGKDGDHDAMAKAKALEERARQTSKEKKRFGPLA